MYPQSPRQDGHETLETKTKDSKLRRITLARSLNLDLVHDSILFGVPAGRSIHQSACKTRGPVRKRPALAAGRVGDSLHLHDLVTRCHPAKRCGSLRLVEALFPANPAVDRFEQWVEVGTIVLEDGRVHQLTHRRAESGEPRRGDGGVAVGRG